MSGHTEQRRNVALAVATVVDGRPHYKIAAEVGINPSTFSGFVSGRVDPTPEQRAAIAAVLGKSERDLFTEVRGEAHEEHDTQVDE